MNPRLADDRTLDVLDFNAVRELVRKQTMTDRGAVRAATLTPNPDVAAVRLEQAATVEMRRVVADAPFDIARSRESSIRPERVM